MITQCKNCKLELTLNSIDGDWMDTKWDEAVCLSGPNAYDSSSQEEGTLEDYISHKHVAITTTRSTRLEEIVAQVSQVIANHWYEHLDEISDLDNEHISSLYAEFGDSDDEEDAKERAIEIALQVARLRLVQLITEDEMIRAAQQVYGDF